VQKKVVYSFGAEGYEIPIKYAQAVLCETPDEKYKWPMGKKKLFGEHLLSCLGLIGAVLLMIVSA
jgi:hypothetical protein